MKAILKTLFVLSIVPFVFSCRQIPENEEVESEIISYNGPISIKINFHGVDYANDNLENTPISENNSWGG